MPLRSETFGVSAHRGGAATHKERKQLYRRGVPSRLAGRRQADVKAFYGEDGTLAELRAAAGALIDQHPRLGKRAGPRWQNFGQFSPQPTAGRVGWDSVLKE